MKYATAHYAEALRRALRRADGKKRRTTLERFLRLLQKHGARRNLRAILHATERQESAHQGRRRVRVESVEELAPPVRKSLEQSLGKARTRYAARPELLGGMRIFIDDEILIDASARTRLERLFTSYARNSH